MQSSEALCSTAPLRPIESAKLLEKRHSSRLAPCHSCSFVAKDATPAPNACIRGLMGCVSFFCDPESGMEDDASVRLQKAMSVHDHGPETDYEVKELLGSGAFADVHLGVEKDTEQEVAIKFVRRKQLSITEEDMALEEARILAIISHKGIMELYGFYETPDHFCLVLELMKGGELFNSIVKRQFYSENCARFVVREMLDVLSFCASKKIVHRDLKPENLMLPYPEDETLIKVGDWGFAAELRPPHYVLRQPMGTPGYAAPEVLRSQPYDCGADVFSAGIIVYVLLSGYRPFEGRTVQEMIMATLKQPLEFHEAHWGSISDEAKDLISGMLQKDPLLRLSADEALEHPWMHMDSEHLEAQCLGSCCCNTLTMLKRFRAREKMRSAVSAVIAANRLSSVLRALPGNDRASLVPTAAPQLQSSADTPSQMLEEPIVIEEPAAAAGAGFAAAKVVTLPPKTDTPKLAPICARQRAQRRKTIAGGVSGGGGYGSINSDAEAAGADAAAGLGNLRSKMWRQHSAR